jgi:crossover junction endodeoxyribonuclease RuvC
VGITPKQFAEMKSRMTGTGRRAAATLPRAAETTSKAHQFARILGIDPSLRGTGYGVIQFSRTGSTALSSGTIHCPATWERSRCLVKIYQTLRQVIGATKPDVCAIEGLFFAQNLQTALIMGEARGVAICCAAEVGLEVYEIAPRKVKQAVVGYGAAQKSAVAKMVQRMLQLAEPPAPDAADALALAIAFASEQGTYALSAPKKL